MIVAAKIIISDWVGNMEVYSSEAPLLYVFHFVSPLAGLAFPFISSFSSLIYVCQQWLSARCFLFELSIDDPVSLVEVFVNKAFLRPAQHNNNNTQIYRSNRYPLKLNLSATYVKTEK